MNTIKILTAAAALTIAGTASAQDHHFGSNTENHSYSHCYRQNGVLACDSTTETEQATYHSLCGASSIDAKCIRWSEAKKPPRPPAMNEHVPYEFAGSGPGRAETDAEYFARTGFHYGARR